MQKNQKIEITSDRALSDPDQDRLGFHTLAANLAKSFSDVSSNDGFVIGLEGKWGSGKSSMLFLIEHEAEKQPAEQKPIFIHLRP